MWGPTSADDRTTSTTAVARRPAGSVLSSSERTMRARIAAYALHAQRGPRETTRAARQAFLTRFDHEVDPDGRLPEAERRRRAEAARRAYFTALALRSARSRRHRTRR
jgi:hypothetical protein